MKFGVLSEVLSQCGCDVEQEHDAGARCRGWLEGYAPAHLLRAKKTGLPVKAALF